MNMSKIPFKIFTKSKMTFGVGLLFGVSLIEIFDKYYTNKLESYVAASRRTIHWDVKD
jgi:hypothetical protein